MEKVLYIFLGGGIGSVLRYAVGLLVATSTPESTNPPHSPHWLTMYPLATLAVNIIGCGIIGIAWGLIDPADTTHDTMRLTLIVGVLGGFTTFSAFGWETLQLLQEQRIATAIAYVLLSVLAGILAAWGGYAITQVITHGGS